MPVDDYRAAIAGGLKLKGVNPSSKITKHRKKKAKPETQSTAADHSKAEVATPNASSETDPTAISAGESIHDKDDPAGGDGAATPPPPPLPPTQAGKTDAEIKHAERRRKRVYSTFLPPHPPNPPFTILPFHHAQLYLRWLARY